MSTFTRMVKPRRPSPSPATGMAMLVWLMRGLLLAAILISWNVIGADDYWRPALSSPLEVLARVKGWLVELAWWGHLWATLEEALLGYLLGLVVALVLVAVISPSKLLSGFFAPYIAALNSLPKIALAPLFIFWFGATLQSKVYFVASLICFIIFHGIQGGLRTIDPVLRDNVRLLGASKVELLVHFYIPAILTWIISSLRLSFAFALLAAVIGEYLGANRGLGFLIASGQLSLQADIVIAGILVVATLTLLVDRMLLATESRMSGWRTF